MIYLSGCTNNKIEPILAASGIGLVITPHTGYTKRAGRYPFYGCDIGMGWTDADVYLNWLDTVERGRCLYAVSPDAYPDAVESQRRGLQYAELIREMGFPPAIVAQDGAETLTWPWDQFDVLFIGGRKETRWKTGPDAEALCREARNHGKWVHMGRVNSWARLERARQMGCNSADGTYLRFPDTNLPRLQHFLLLLDMVRPFPQFLTYEGHALPIHKEAAR